MFDACNKDCPDQGRENIAAAKRVELVLDEMLSNLATKTTVENSHNPDSEYILEKKQNYEAENKLTAGLMLKKSPMRRRTHLTDIHPQRKKKPQEKQNIMIFALCFTQNSLGAKITSGMPQGTGAVEAGFDKLGTLVNKYGAIPEGENPHSAGVSQRNNIPKQTADDNVVSQTVKTAL